MCEFPDCDRAADVRFLEHQLCLEHRTVAVQRLVATLPPRRQSTPA
jgi:hypothetical protein